MVSEEVMPKIRWELDRGGEHVCAPQRAEGRNDTMNTETQQTGAWHMAGKVRQLPAPSLQAPASPRPTMLQAAA